MRKLFGSFVFAAAAMFAAVPTAEAQQRRSFEYEESGRCYGSRDYCEAREREARGQRRGAPVALTGEQAVEIERLRTERARIEARSRREHAAVQLTSIITAAAVDHHRRQDMRGRGYQPPRQRMRAPQHQHDCYCGHQRCRRR